MRSSNAKRRWPSSSSPCSVATATRSRTLYERFHRIVHAIALAHLRVDDSADVVQDVFAEVWLKIVDAARAGRVSRLDRHARAPPRDRSRVRKRGPATTSTTETSPSSRRRTPRRSRRSRAIRALPETYRETMIMRLVEGLTGPEIAERTGMTPDSVRVHLHRGMKLLREKLEGIAMSDPLFDGGDGDRRAAPRSTHKLAAFAHTAPLREPPGVATRARQAPGSGPPSRSDSPRWSRS